jgi:hypothetical protein
MNILFFLGSGVSYKTGLPDTKTITERLLNEDWHYHTDSNFYSGLHPHENWRDEDITPLTQKFLKYIKKFADSYLKERGIEKVNYEDIFYIVKQLHDELSFETDNPAIKFFIEHLIEEFDIENNPDFVELGIRMDFKDFCWKAKDFINCVVWQSVYTSSHPKGFDLLKEIIECDEFEKIDVATLNHDLLIEKFLKDIKIEYCDGFSEPDGDFCYFVPELYNEKSNKIRLFKLHGSVNWYRLRDYDKKTNTTTDFYAKVINNDHWHCKNSKGEMLSTIKSYPIFLTGTMNKLSDYNFGIVRSVHLKFDEVLYKYDNIIMSGYGWNDKGINGRLMEWLLNSDDRKLILLHEEPESIKKSKSAMWHRYDDLIKWKRLIPMKKWMSDTKLDDIRSYLN